MFNKDLITVEDMSKKLKPILGAKIDTLYMNYSFTDDIEKKREIAQFIQALYLKYVSHAVLKNQILLEPPAKEVMGGEYPLGIISYAGNDIYAFNLREQDWQRHVCITGMSGSGKTTLAFQIIRNFIVRNKSFLIMDWKKSFRPLMLIDKEILLFTVGNETVSNGFKVNINRPPRGVPPKEWISILTDVILESFNACHGTAKIIAETLDEAFRDFMVYQGSENYPTWKQILDRLQEKENESRMNRRETEWLTTAVRIAHMLTFGDFGSALCTKGAEEMNVEEIMDKKIIFEMYSLNTVQKKFFCEYLLTYISMLDIGQAIVRLAERYNDPFMIKVPFIPLKRENVGNGYVIARMKAYIKEYLLRKAKEQSTEDKIGDELEHLRKVYFISGVNASVSELKQLHVNNPPKAYSEILTGSLTAEEKIFLDLVGKEELSVSQTYSKLGLSARKGNAIKDSLINKQLITVKEEKNNKGWKKLLMPAVAVSMTA